LVPPNDQSDPPSTARNRPGYLVDLLVETITDYAIFALDAHGCVATWNPGAQRLKGYTAGDIIGRHFSCFYPPADVEAGKPDYELAEAGVVGHFEDEGWRVRKDGTTFWANVVITALRNEDGELVGFGKVTRDLTDRKRAEEELRQSEERFRLLVSSVADYAIFLLEPDGTVASWNLGAERLKGYRANEIIGRHISTFYTEPDLARGVPATALREALANGRWEDEGWRVRKGGTTFWANVVITALHGDDGEHRGYAKVTRDLTDRKRNEDALHAAAEREHLAAAQLRELDRMRTELVAVVAHDLRAPVGLIQHLAHRLAVDWETVADEEKRGSFQRIAARAVTLGALVDDVFDMVLIDAGRLDLAAVPFDLGALVREVVMDAGTAEPARTITAAVDADARVVGDARRTWQVLSNLVGNAVKFSPPGAPIVVTVERAGPDVAVAVTDAGPGIPTDQHDLVFQRFTRLATSAGAPGSGVGLFIAKSFVEAQHGAITLDSEPGAGSTFRFTLPAAS
jgi:PAS domain S-box-containing protein